MDVLSTILENTDTIYMVIDSNTKQIIFINNAFSRLLGYSAQEYLFFDYKKCLKDIVPWESESLNTQFTQQATKEQMVHIRYLNQTIEPFWVKGQRIIDSEKTCYYLNLTPTKKNILIEPITQPIQKEAIESLQMMQTGYWVLYNLRKPGYFSEALYSITGFDYLEFQPTFKNIISLVHHEDIGSLLSKIRTFLSSDNTHLSAELRLHHKTGNWHWYYIRCYKMGQADTLVDNQKVMGVIKDIDNRKKTELALLKYNHELREVKEHLTKRNDEFEEVLANLRIEQDQQKHAYNELANHEKLFRQVTENLGDVIWVRDSKTILFINSAFKTVWGHDPKEVILDPGIILNWVHPDDRINFETWINLEQLSANEPFVEQYRIIKPDGTIRWIWSRTFPVFDENGQIYRIVGIASDITELKQYENALKEAKEKAQESDKLKSAFLANISHEIRTPMNGIVGFSELLTKEDLPESLRDNYIEIIKKSSNQLIRIIDDIINISKIEANLIELKIQPLHVKKLFSDIEILFNNQLKTFNVTDVAFHIEINLKDFQLEILSDEIRLKQIISNLLNNAIKYTPKGSIELKCQLEDRKLIFSVKDTGIGITPEKQSIIFDHFRQADEGNTRKFGGTGLGLSISKGLVQLFEGDIWFESKYQHGSTFYFSIPFIPCENKIHPIDNVNLLTSSIRWPDKAILIVEDEPLNYEFLKEILKPTGAMLIRAENGSQAVKMCNNLEFHIILMDIRLPVMSGLEATQRIREKGIKTPIIAQTAYSLQDDMQTCLDAGCNDYLSKPIKKEFLIRMMDYYITHPNSKEIFSEL